MANVDFEQTKQDMLDINKGLKDQISYIDELGKLKNKYNKSNEREKGILSDVLDKTKDIFKNRKMLSDEQLNTVDLHKLERKLIAEGLDDQVKFVQKLKEEDRIQKQINRTINAQAKVYNNIGSSIDSFIRKIPGGGLLGDLLGTGDLGKEMSESFRTSISGGGMVGELSKNITGEAGGGIIAKLFDRGKGSKAKMGARAFFAGGLKGALGTTLVFGAAAKLFSVGMSQGFQSQSAGQAIKRFFAGGAFEGVREAFGTGAAADFGTLAKLKINKRLFGVSEKDQAKILAAQVNISGASQKTALNIQKSLMSSAAMRGVLPEDVMSDLANNTEQFATYARDGGQNIGEAAIRARELGISLDTVFKVSDGILDFQSSIENELKASLLIGRQLNLNEARRLAMAGDMAGLQEEILRQVGSEEELQRMNAIQRKSLAGALGVTVQELNKLASGDLEVKNSDMKQNTTALTMLTAVMGALALSQGVKLAGQGLRFGSQLIRGFSGKVPANMSKYTGKRTKLGLPDMRTTLGKTFMAGNVGTTTRGLATTGGRLGTGLARGASRFGPYGLALAAIITGITALVKNTKQTSDNTKSKSLPNFITSNVTRG